VKRPKVLLSFDYQNGITWIGGMHIRGRKFDVYNNIKFGKVDDYFS
jgi:hypothetical protein